MVIFLVLTCTYLLFARIAETNTRVQLRVYICSNLRMDGIFVKSPIPQTICKQLGLIICATIFIMHAYMRGEGGHGAQSRSQRWRCIWVMVMITALVLHIYTYIVVKMLLLYYIYFVGRSVEKYIVKPTVVAIS